MKQDALAEALGYYSRVSISHVETGREDLPLTKVFALAEALGVSPSELFAPVSMAIDAEASASAAMAVTPEWDALLVKCHDLTEADRQVVQRLVDFLSEADPELRRHMEEHIEAMQALKEKRARERGSGGVGEGDTLVG
jgi:transcriptional regulator with XRE-family HTH domain